MALTLTSPAFSHNADIPRKYTCQGQDVNPPLQISNVPADAKSLILIVDDPDAPMGTWDHWVLFNIPVDSDVGENTVPARATQGRNSWGRNAYGGPCPPSGKHRYLFKLYAIDTTLMLTESATKRDVERAIEGHILAQAELIGLYQKS